MAAGIQNEKCETPQDIESPKEKKNSTYYQNKKSFYTVLEQISE